MDGASNKRKQLEAPFEVVVKKQRLMAETTETVDQWLAECNKYKMMFASDKMDEEGSVAKALETFCKTVTSSNAVEKFSKGQKELHAAINKMGKVIDKVLEPDISKISRKIQFDKQLLYTVIAQHLFREGRFQTGAIFLKETNLTIPEEMKKPFIELHQILEAINARDVRPAINWAKTKRAELEAIGSTIEFQFHKLQFSNYLRNGQAQEALLYARQHFGHFATKEMKEIQMLMGSLVYCGQLEFSPYANLVSGMADIDLKAQFARDYCRLLGLPQDSALYTCVTAGTLAIPTLLKAATLMKDKPDWNTGEQLPVEIELQIDPTNPNAAAHNVYHSIFSCPVSKEQSTPTNPPVRLPCGHAICKQSMERLLRQNTRRYKCPYCPSEGTAEEATQIYF